MRQSQCLERLTRTGIFCVRNCCGLTLDVVRVVFLARVMSLLWGSQTAGTEKCEQGEFGSLDCNRTMTTMTQREEGNSLRAIPLE